MREMIDYVLSQVQGIDHPELRLRRLIQVQIELIETYPELTELILLEQRQSGKYLRSEAIEQVQRYLGIIETIVEEGMGRHLFAAEIDPEVVATMLYAGIEGLATRWVLEGRRYSLDEAASTVTRIFLDGIRRTGEELSDVQTSPDSSSTGER
jgi:TetR/AcrR family fatty acid metabolism transcriptional regulator